MICFQSVLRDEGLSNLWKKYRKNIKMAKEYY